MKKLFTLLCLLFILLGFAGCIVSISPDMETIWVVPGQQITFQVKAIPQQVKYTWYIDETQVPDLTGDSFDYTHPADIESVAIAVEATGIIGINRHEWTIVTDPEKKEFTDNMTSILTMYGIPSVSACILKKTDKGIWEIPWQGVYGNRVMTPVEQKADLNTIYPIGSITKVFMATAVMQLVENGHIDLESSASDYLGFPVKNPGLDTESSDDPTPPITIRHLLSHRSGLSRMPMSVLAKYINVLNIEIGAISNIKDLKKLLEDKETWKHTINNTELHFKPGEVFSYSNIGYMMLGFIIENITGITWNEYIRKNILEPLEMKNTNFYWSEYPVNMINRAYGYVEKKFIEDTNKELLVPADPAVENATLRILYNVGGPAGTIKSTPSDLARFMTVHLNNGAGYQRDQNGDIMRDETGEPIEIRILSPASITEMHQFHDAEFNPVPREITAFRLDLKVGYGFGWLCVNLGGRYWNYPWNPILDPETGVDWDELALKGIIRNDMWNDGNQDQGGGLDIQGHGGDMPGYHSAMYKISDRLAFIYLLNDGCAYSQEGRDEHLMQPERFMLYTSPYDGAADISYYDTTRKITIAWALPHYKVKMCELQYLLIKKAASLM